MMKCACDQIWPTHTETIIIFIFILNMFRTAVLHSDGVSKWAAHRICVPIPYRNNFQLQLPTASVVRVTNANEISANFQYANCQPFTAANYWYCTWKMYPVALFQLANWNEFVVEKWGFAIQSRELSWFICGISTSQVKLAGRYRFGSLISLINN